MGVWLYTIISVLVVSIASFAGVLTLAIREQRLKKMLLYLVSLSAGALFGDAFIHLLPEAVESFGFNVKVSLLVLSGIGVFFVLEKILHWHHHYHKHKHEHKGKKFHAFAIMNLFGDFVHNFIDGIIIGASYLASIPLGIATTMAVVLHEIPQEIGDFGVLLHGGFSKYEALVFNFLTALAAFLGALLALMLGSLLENINMFLLPFAAGGFIYIAGSDLIPELHKEVKVSRSVLQLLSFILGIGLMLLLLLFE